MLFASLLLDGLTGVIQEHMLSRRSRPSSHLLMLALNMWSMIFLAVGTLFLLIESGGVCFVSDAV